MSDTIHSGIADFRVAQVQFPQFGKRFQRL